MRSRHAEEVIHRRYVSSLDGSLHLCNLGEPAHEWSHFFWHAAYRLLQAKMCGQRYIPPPLAQSSSQRPRYLPTWARTSWLVYVAQPIRSRSRGAHARVPG